MIKKKLLPFALFIITALYYIPVINLPLTPYDEGAILVGAERVLDGEIPHKDFSFEYPAGQLYVLSSLFKVFGTSVATERVYDLLVKSCLSISIFVIIGMLCSNTAALGGWLMSLVWLQHSSFPAYPVYPTIFFAYLGVYFLLREMREHKIYYLLLSALSIVCAVLFRHDIGGYAAIAMTAVIVFRVVLGVQSWVELAIFAVCGIAAVLPVMAFFSAHSAIGMMYNDLLIIPMAFLEQQSFPYPYFSRWNLSFYIFPLVVMASIIVSLLLIKRDKNDFSAYAILLIACIGILFFNQVRVRSDVIHLLPLALTGILLAPVLFYRLTTGLSVSIWKKRTACMLFIFVFAVALSKPAQEINRLLSITNGYIVKQSSQGVERASHLNINGDLKDTIAYIKSRTRKNELIYVGVKNHDQFVFNDTIIYFLSNRRSASRYHVLNPGVQTTAAVQMEMIGELKEKAPPLIVLVPRNRYEPNLSNIDSMVDLLDNFIAEEYALEKSFGIYEIWMKKA